MRPAGLVVMLVACHTPQAVPDSAGGDSGDTDAQVLPVITITSTIDNVVLRTDEAMLAAAEMQISGEPLAEAMGRDLGGYSRDLLPTDIYLDRSNGTFWIDLPGFSTGVESYEYSKQPMNFVAFESGAGTALAPAVPDLAAMVQHFAAGSNALGKWVFPAGTWPTGNAFGDLNPTGAGTGAANPIGWPGIWPTLHPFRNFDSAIDPTNAVALQCSIASDDNPSETPMPLIGADYECDATTLHLRERDEGIITASTDGFASWKYALWVINYLQIMHDDANQPVDAVPEADLGLVGTPGYPVHLGSSDIEGFQAQMFIAMLDVRADDWLRRLTTTDGATLSGFASVAAAKAYDYAAPARWFPSELSVTETPAPGFPIPAYTIATGSSEVFGLAALALGYAEAYALTDAANPDVGGSQATRVFFDGDPFDATTLRDHALAMIRVAVIDLDRLHTASGSTTLDTTYTLIALRTVLRSLGSQLALYSNNTPDTATGTPLDAFPLQYPSDPTLTFAQRVRVMIRERAAIMYDHMTDDTGRAFTAWPPFPGDTGDTLDAHTAAIRGLFTAYLATGDVRYRTRAIAVFDRVEAVFYDPQARIYDAAPAPTDIVNYRPVGFALLQSTLRDMYELVATRPGGEALEPVLEERLARLNKLVLNGWDDRDRNKHVDAPGECTNVIDGVPRGGLQMAERTLTGEVGRLKDEGGGPSGPPTSDRDADCVPEIDDAHLPAMLANGVTFRIAR